MRFTVNENCIGCSLCTGLCPDVFTMNEEDLSVAIEGDVPKQAEASAIKAMEECPVSAIEQVD